MKNFLKKYFLPHEDNHYKPHFLRTRTAILTLAVLVVVELGFLAQAFIFSRTPGFLAAVLPGVLIDLTNEQRAQNNVSSVKENPLLDEAAQLKADDMAAKGYFSHVTPEGYSPWYWLDKVGYKYMYAGENLAVNFFDSTDVANAWMNSPEHRANILKANYTDIGIAMAEGNYQGHATVFVVQFFGSQATSTAAVATSTTSLAAASAPATTTEASASSTLPIIASVSPSATPTPPAVKGASVNPAPAAPVETAVAAPAPTKTVTLAPAVKAPSASQVLVSNPIEKAAASPRHTADDIFTAILLVILAAVVLAVFVEINVQHPTLVLNGLWLVAVILGFIILNNYIILAPGVHI